MRFPVEAAYIYALCHPLNLRPYYIGQTTCPPEKRLSEHIKVGNYGSKPTRVGAWAAACDGAGQRPMVFVIDSLENVTNEEVNIRERFWVDHYTTKYPGLLNWCAKKHLVDAIEKSRLARKKWSAA